MGVRVEKIGNATLYLGDCREILPGLERPAAVITDPPYGQKLKHVVRKTPGKGVRYVRNGHWLPIIGDDAEFDPALLLNLAPITLIWGQHRLAHKLPLGTVLVWDKTGGGKTAHTTQSHAETAWLNDMPPRTVRLKSVVWSGLAVGTEAKEDCRPGVRRVHPAQKPAVIMRWCIEKARVPPGGVILDPYMGSGSTGVAAMQLGFPFIGIEIDPGYFDTACRRIEAAARQGVLQPAPVKP